MSQTDDDTRFYTALGTPTMAAIRAIYAEAEQARVASLISAAPSMYAALLAADRALRHLPFHTDECGSCDRIAHLTHEIADALAKADGRE